MFRRARLTLTLWYAGALTITLLAIGTVAYLAVRSRMDAAIDNSITQASADLLTTGVPQTSGAPSPGSGSADGNDDHHARDPRFYGSEQDRAAAVQSDVFFVVTDAKGKVLSNPRQVDVSHFDLKDLAKSVGNTAVMTDISADGEHYRVEASANGTSDGTMSYLVVGRSLEARDSQLRTLALVMLIGGGVGVALSCFGGFWLADRALIPIRRSMRTQQRFVSDASHELRTPIAVVKANNELILRHPEATVEASLDQLEAVAAETDHMARLVEDLLTLARADEGRAAVARETLDLGAVVDEVGRDMGALAELRGLHLSVSTESVQVEGDRQRLRQLAVILVDNALKYTPAGGSVAVRLRRNGRRAELVVQDSGPGIAPADQARVFDRFFRVDSARTRPVGGTGLGLAIAAWIADVHDGRITLESTPGNGSTFTVRLPVRD